MDNEVCDTQVTQAQTQAKTYAWRKEEESKLLGTCALLYLDIQLILYTHTYIHDYPQL
jgi:hypothetical protein